MRLLRSLDPILMTLTMLLIACGLVLLYSATSQEAGHLFLKQCVWLPIGLAAMLVTISLDYRYVVQHAGRIYAIALLLLAYVLLFGHSAYGAQRWIRFGAVGFQPSEFAKLAIIVMLARYVTSDPAGVGTLRRFVTAVGIALLPMALILRQPDLGTALVILPVTFAVLWMGRARPRHLLGLAAAGASAIPIAWLFLREYQRDRVLTFLNPEYDPLAAGWTGVQAKIAVGSGGVLGKGFLAGTQGQLQFVPQHHTDFIFAVLGEEWGFVGTLFVLFLFFLVVLQAVKIGREARDDIGVLLAAGIVALFTFQVGVNVGMTVGLAPITGIPLPFLSLGGTSLLKSLVAIGLLHNIRTHSRSAS